MKNFFLIASAVLLAASCTGSLFNAPGPSAVSDSSLSHDMIVLGSKLDDPYSVENMTKALNAVYPTKAERVVVQATHLYLRFLPADESEMQTLENAGLELLDHPVNYEIVKEGDYYHDPSIPEDNITWQYTVVPVGTEYPEEIRHEILSECYIPDDSDDADTKSGGIDWAEVEREAYKLTGNAALLSPDTRGKEKYTPEGRISIVDDKLGNDDFGVAGVKVSCNSFVKFAHGYTDDEGYYKVNKSFSANPRYRIVFKNDRGFCIGFNLLFSPASSSTLGRNSPTGVDCVVTSSSDRKLFSRCVVNNAGHDYYTSCRQDEDSITTPPSNLRIWIFRNLNVSSAVMLHHGAIIDNGIIGEFLGEYAILLKIFLPDLTIGIKDAESYADIYSRTIHELAHASHFMQVGTDYWDKYIEYIVTSYISSGFITYGTGTENNYGYCEVGEMWGYYMQSQFYRERYDDEEKVFGADYWFYPQIFLYLDDRGLDRYKIFAALTSDIDSREMLKKKLTSLYPEFKSAIVQAFSRYN